MMRSGIGSGSGFAGTGAGTSTKMAEKRLEEADDAGADIMVTPCPVTPVTPCFNVDTAAQITVKDFPGHAAGTVHITVTTPGGTSTPTAADMYSYAPIPTVSSVAPMAIASVTRFRRQARRDTSGSYY